MSTAQDLPAVPATPALRLAPTVDDAALPGGDLDFDAFVRRYEGRLRRLVQRRLGDPGDAEEIAQETLLRAYQHRHSFTAEDELIAWSTVVAQRLVIDRVRVRGRAVAVAEVPETYRVGRDTAEIVVARAEALEAIPERQAAILWAREVEGLHYDDIADRFGITEPAVRSLLHRGRRALRKEYARRGGSLPLGGLIPLAPWLIALQTLGKVRTAARGPVRALGPATTALALAGTVFVGLGGGSGALPDARSDVALSPGKAHRSAYELTLPRDPEAMRPALPAAPARPKTAAGPSKVMVPLPGVDRHCATRYCVWSSGDGPPRGDVLYLGPEDVHYPTGQPFVSSLNTVPICDVVPDGPATRCESGNHTSKPSTSTSDPASGALR